jgi:hypothetical protein
MKYTMKSFSLFLCAYALTGILPAHAQSADPIFASGFETTCAAPNNQGVPFNLINTTPYATFLMGAFPGVIDFVVTSPLLSANQAIAYEFVAPGLTLQNGFIQSISAFGSVVTSISECPGEFGNPLQSCYGGEGKSQVNWQVFNGGNGNPSFCQLVPGRTYYLNVGVLVCSTGTCAVKVKSGRFF